MFNKEDKYHAFDNRPFEIKNGTIKRINETNMDEEKNKKILYEVDVKPNKGETYKEFFKRAMKAYGIDKIENMSKEEKDKFFTDIERSYRKEDPKTDDKDKVDESVINEEKDASYYKNLLNTITKGIDELVKLGERPDIFFGASNKLKAFKQMKKMLDKMG